MTTTHPKPTIIPIHVPLDPGRTLAEQVEACRFDGHVSCTIKDANFPVLHRDGVHRELVLACFHRDLEDNPKPGRSELLREIDKLGLRPEGPRELCAIGEHYPHWHERFPLIRHELPAEPLSNPSLLTRLDAIQAETEFTLYCEYLRVRLWRNQQTTKYLSLNNAMDFLTKQALQNQLVDFQFSLDESRPWSQHVPVRSYPDPFSGLLEKLIARFTEKPRIQVADTIQWAEDEEGKELKAKLKLLNLLPALSELGLRPEGMLESCALAHLYPDFQDDFPIVARVQGVQLEHRDYLCYPVLSGRDGQRSLGVYNGESWVGLYWFLCSRPLRI